MWAIQPGGFPAVYTLYTMGNTGGKGSYGIAEAACAVVDETGTELAGLLGRATHMLCALCRPCMLGHNMHEL